MEYLRRHTPRWVIFLIDLLICLFSISAAYLLRFNFQVPGNELRSLMFIAPYIISIRAISFLISRLYAGIVRYTSTKDAVRIFLTITSGSLLFALTNPVTYYFITGSFFIPFSIIILDYVLTMFVMTGSRLLVKILFFEYMNPSKTKTNVIIYGTDELAVIMKRTLDRDTLTHYRVVAFMDNTNRNVGKQLEGATIYNADRFEQLLEKYDVTHLIFAKKFVSTARNREIIDLCLNREIKILHVPDVSSWINGELSVKQIRDIRIEDLLEREPIKLDVENIKREVLNKTILVTGAAGSIGREIVIQLTRFNPKTIVLFDQAETPLYELELELKEKFRFDRIKIIIGDINNNERLEYIFTRYRPSVIYHAAAYKHVPMMERNPAEAVLTNIHGTKVLADISSKYEAAKFVMISTDKAVNPSNVMGASKRIAEMYIQAMNQSGKTRFVTTRFGNVLGSSGSVIPRFKKQIEEGGPLTVTHPEVTRYFMTIPEACQLVLEAGAMGRGGEIFLFDMGESVKIADLARKMIRLSGLAPGRDVQISFTGMRPGEKLYEELLADKENNISTYHPQIMIAKVRECDYNEISAEISTLITLAETYNNYGIVRRMKEIVPEFISNNSVYEQIDQERKDRKNDSDGKILSETG